MWGVPPPSPPSTHLSVLQSLQKLGYVGCEVISFGYNDPAFVHACTATGMILLPQLHTGGGYADPKTGEYVYIGTLSVAGHLESLKKELGVVMKLKIRNPTLRMEVVNVHAGVDTFVHDEEKRREFIEGWVKVVSEVRM